MTSVAFQSILRKQIGKFPKILKSAKIIHYYSLFFIRVLRRDAAAEGGDERAHGLLPLPRRAGREGERPRPGEPDAPDVRSRARWFFVVARISSILHSIQQVRHHLFFIDTGKKGLRCGTVLRSPFVFSVQNLSSSVRVFRSEPIEQSVR